VLLCATIVITGRGRIGRKLSSSSTTTLEYKDSDEQQWREEGEEQAKY
jgi:hypothetical protein